MAAAPALQPTFAVPNQVHRMLQASATAGAADTRAWLVNHPSATLDDLVAFVETQLGPPPSNPIDDAVTGAAVRSRDAAHDAQAAYIDNSDNVTVLWTALTQRIGAFTGPAQALKGATLLARAYEVGDTLSGQIKSKYKRKRPWQTKPAYTRTPGVRANGFSYPSGHSTEAFARAGVLAARDAAHRGAYLQLAEQIAYSRVYAGAHYATDVAAGAYLGSAIAEFLVAREG